MVYNKEIINSLSEYYNQDIETDDQLKALFSRFIEEYHSYIAKYIRFNSERLLLKLNSNTQSSTLIISAFAQIIKNHTQLLLSAGDGDLEAVKYLVERAEVDVNIQDEDGYTPLMIAANDGRLDVVKYLVETAKVDVNVKNLCGDTALTLAADDGYLDVVKYLVEIVKVDVDVRDGSGSTALMTADDGHLDVVKYLVETAKVDVNAESYYGKTALMLAAENGHLDVKKYLKGHVQMGLGIGILVGSILGAVMAYAAHLWLGILNNATVIEEKDLDMSTELENVTTQALSEQIEY